MWMGGRSILALPVFVYTTPHSGLLSPPHSGLLPLPPPTVVAGGRAADQDQMVLTNYMLNFFHIFLILSPKSAR